MASQLDLDDVCAGHQKARAELKRLRSIAARNEKRLITLRGWMRETDWCLFCSDYPKAHNWFDEDGMPR